MRVVLALLLFVALALLKQRLSEIFVLSIQHRRVHLVRGRVHGPLLQAFTDIARDAGIDRASLRAIWTMTGARLVVRGVDEATAQRLRNVFGAYPPSGPPSA